MSTEMVRLNITLPSFVTEELNKFAAPRKRSQFIAEAIKIRLLGGQTFVFVMPVRVNFQVCEHFPITHQ